MTPNEWRPLFVRATAFPATVLRPGFSQNWWELIVGQGPEERSESPKKPASEEIGPVGSGRLRLRVQPERVDWIYSAGVNILEPTTEIPTLGTFGDTAALFGDWIQRWMDIAAIRISRMAFAGVVVVPTASREEAYEQLSNALPINRLDPKWTDFQFKINRPLQSETLPDLRINRLTTWSAMIFQVERGVQEAGVPKVIESPELTAIRLEFDVNTDPLFPHPFESSDQPALFHELVRLSLRLATHFDNQ